MKQYWVYLLRCADGSYYTGVTNNIDRREWEHNAGILECAYTHSRRPVKLVYADVHADINQAIAWEKHVKGWSRAKKRALAASDWDRIRELVHRHGPLSDS